MCTSVAHMAVLLRLYRCLVTVGHTEPHLAHSNMLQPIFFAAAFIRRTNGRTWGPTDRKSDASVDIEDQGHGGTVTCWKLLTKTG